MVPLESRHIAKLAIAELFLMGVLLMAWGSDLKGYEMAALGMKPGGAVTAPPPWSHKPAAIAPPKHTYPSSNPSQSGPSGHKILADLVKICPGIVDVRRGCPACTNMNDRPLTDLIPHLNDTHVWPREKIADWLDIINMDPDVDLTVKLPDKEGNSGRAGADKEAV